MEEFKNEKDSKILSLPITQFLLFFYAKPQLPLNLILIFYNSFTKSYSL